MYNRLLLFVFSFFIMIRTYSQQEQITQTIRGNVLAASSSAPAAFSSIKVLGLYPEKTVVADSGGNFKILKVPVGRYDLEVSQVGYQPQIIKELIVQSGKETFVTVYLLESEAVLNAVVIKPRVVKSRPINTMAVTSARMFSVEETKRYAGGFDDYARLASSFAGVASNIGNNGVIIRGNAPRLVQWKMEGVEIPNPNHFADLATFGGGGLTGLSSQLLANSDFFSGAFPAEYTNALSGVFDMNMRKGNNEKRETTLQVGLLGIDAAMEGPFTKERSSSYLVNYRYSTLGLLQPILPDDAGGTHYQDLSFKLHFPAKKAGTLSFWGIGLKDKSGTEPETDKDKWEYLQDKEKQHVNQYMGAAGLSHRLFLNKHSSIKTTLAYTLNGVNLVTDRMNNNMNLQAFNRIRYRTGNLILSSQAATRINNRHTNKTGITATILYYNLLLKEARQEGMPLQMIVDEEGSSALLNAYSSSSYTLSPKVLLNAGISSQWFTLNQRKSIEPRIGIKYQFQPNHSVAFAYGLHSRLERMNYYFTKPFPGSTVLHNKDLDFTKAHHLVLGYDWNISPDLHLKIEPYYQQLFNVPVIEDSSYSFINMENDWFLDKRLLNIGKGRNVGVDITLEKYMSKGIYYLFTTSLSDSRYKGGDGIWRNTRFNRNYLINVLGGKEWEVGIHKKNMLGINVRISYQGGNHYIPVNEMASILRQDIVYDGKRAFEKSIDPLLLTHFTITYKKNKKRSTHEWALKVINATNQKEFYGFRYNLIRQRVDINRESLIVPNLSYKIDF